ncbi:MAG TPA: hypothetical protein VMR06_11460 [Dokdonella sp.]|uniref:hypothetical protein n=1 Tax=Dokdonella sp. TaxID=2291710 RepID=UPI002CB0882A|nr:hypothetical protein [Dokdonella sp.]HUD42595.1 hypothetical protein [Dokdonella sp.]
MVELLCRVGLCNAAAVAAGLRIAAIGRSCNGGRRGFARNWRSFFQPDEDNA